RSMPRALSNSARPSTSIRPERGLTSPAMALSTVVLPAPEGPTSATTRALSSIRTSRSKRPRRSWMSRLSIGLPPAVRGSWLVSFATPAVLAPHQPLRGQQRQQRDRHRHQRHPPDPELAAGDLHQLVDRP